MKRLLLTGGFLFDGQRFRRFERLFLEEERLFLEEPPSGFEPEETLSLGGKWLLPPLCDLSVRLRSPEPLERERQAALRGGIGAFCLQPSPELPLDRPEMVAQLRRREGVEVLPVASLTVGFEGERLSEMGLLAEAGAVGLAATGNLRDLALWRRAFLYAGTFGLTLFVRPEASSLSRGCAHEGETALRMGLPTIPTTAETALAAALIELAAETGARLHLSCLSAARTVELVAEAKARGLPVTADVALPNLLWSEEALGGWESGFHLRPPLREASDRQALLEGVACGAIDAIVSDHTPLPAEAKEQPLPASLPGMASLQLLLPLVAQLIERGELVSSALAALTGNPWRLLGRAPRGWLLFDPEKRFRVEGENWLSSGSNTPFLGEELRGQVVGRIDPEGVVLF